MAGSAVKKVAGVAYPLKRYAALNQCAYCDATDNLSDEHIIPFGLGGELVLPKGSCEKHRKATSKVEDFALRRYLCPLRSHLGLPSRKPHLRPDGYPFTLKRGSLSWKRKVLLKDHPGLVRFVIFDPPGRVAGRSETSRGVMLLDAPLPGLDSWEEVKASRFTWHIKFHQTPDLPEQLIAGREAIYFRHFLAMIAVFSATLMWRVTPSPTLLLNICARS
ncbi:MAG TPA: hypothetical protein VEG68_10455 [Terriglobales bacterium]|nr:hypothetical protein [Terriglobales bacterium]